MKKNKIIGLILSICTLASCIPVSAETGTAESTVTPGSQVIENTNAGGGGATTSNPSASPVPVPSPRPDLVYNGNTQTGVYGGTGYTIENNTAVNAGNYVANATLSDNGIWDDSTTEPKQIPWSIAKANHSDASAAYTIPRGAEIRTDIVTGNDIAEGYAFGTPTVADTNEMFDGTPSFDGENLICKIKETASTGTTATITTEVTTTNYKNYSFVITITAGKAAQSPLTITSADTLAMNETLTLTADGGSGTGTLSFIVTDVTGSATLNGNILTPVSAGTITVKAVKEGDTSYERCESAEQTVTISKLKPTGEPKFNYLYAYEKTLADTGLTTEGGTFSVPGTVIWVDSDGVTPLDPATVVTLNATYKWLFTPTDNATYDTLLGEASPFTSSSSRKHRTVYYTVSFETNGGTEIDDKSVRKNSLLKLPSDPIKTGYAFDGWYTDKALTAKYNTKEYVTKSMTLYAAWSKKDNSDNQIVLTVGSTIAYVFGEKVVNDVAPVIRNSRAMLPSRFVAEALGATVSWNDANRLMTIRGKDGNGKDVLMLIYIDSDIAYVNGAMVKLDSPAFIENDRTYTPIRFIAERLGAMVDWDEDTQRIIITKN